MADLSRIGIAIPEDLLRDFDIRVEKRGYASRSEAFRDLIRDDLIREETLSPGKQVYGTLTLAYDHHHRMLQDKLTAIQHDFHHLVVSTIHVHVDHNNCLEVLILRGKSGEVRQLGDLLISTKGVFHGHLSITAPQSPVSANR